MPKAVLHKSVIVLLEPLPAEWQEGTKLEIVKANEPALDIDAWTQTMNQLCADSPKEEEQAMNGAIEEHRQQAKAPMRREMASPP